MICRRRNTASVILVSVALGCSSQDPLESSGSAELGATTTPKVLECPKTNVLLRVPYTTACAEEYPGHDGSWIGGAVTRAQEGVEAPRPRFCSYYWDAPRIQPDTSVLPGEEGRAWQWDCARVGAHGAREDMYAALSAHGKHLLGDGFKWTTNTEKPVRVAVIDTAAGTWSDRDNNPHGKAVGTLVRDTACLDPTSCKVQVENYLGLPLIRVMNTPGRVVIRQDLVRGGAFGSHGDLARAIVRAVADNPTPNEPTPTVINLSVAYDSDELLATGEPDPNDFENAVVLEALEYARCHDALILAAAGNGRVPAIDEQKPALPARWTGRRALDAATCSARYNVTPAVSGGPLLYAVSGVDFAAKPLLNTRGAGQSMLTALGFAVVREDPDGGFTRILSGSSMATATVSGLAAALWSHAPAGTTGDAIIRELYDVSEGIAAAADFAPYQPSNTKFFNSARRLTRCSIANSSFGVAQCTAVAPVTTVPDSVVPDLPEDAVDGTKVDDYAPEPGIYPLDFPWLRPQPEGEPGCTSCSIKLALNRIDLILRSGFSVKSNTLRLLAKKSNVAGIASLTSGETLDVVADFATESAPYTVDLSPAELGTTTAAELSYQILVDGVTVDLSESVLLEP
ncbi:MAG: S8/S53 family peptidase [Myxococcota bacterium]|nr:S8/S53 family peptidase [Myxococcota bacterium]